MVTQAGRDHRTSKMQQAGQLWELHAYGDSRTVLGFGAPAPTPDPDLKPFHRATMSGAAERPAIAAPAAGRSDLCGGPKSQVGEAVRGVDEGAPEEAVRHLRVKAPRDHPQLHQTKIDLRGQERRRKG